MALTLHDTLSGRDRRVALPGAADLSLYVCGPTVSDRAHVGHGRTYLTFDLLRRAAAANGLNVLHAMNFTDYEDKITERARGLGLGWRQLARREERGFRRVLDRFGLLAPTWTPRASEFVPEMIATIRRLERAALVEARPDGLYYAPSGRGGGPNFPAGEELERHAVPEPDHPFPSGSGRAREFLLWHRQLPPNPSWSSPWGRGAPGWHVECFAMASQKLGVPVMVHGGGVDLRFPHHFAENEISHALTGRPFARTFVHTGLLTEHHEKMSKSTGNLIALDDAIDRWGADALKSYLIATPYHLRLDWSEVEVDRAADRWAAMGRRFAESLRPRARGTLCLRRLAAVERAIRRALNENLSTPRALDALAGWTAEIERTARPGFEGGDRRSARAAYRRIGGLLGVDLVGGATARAGR